jgi:hypothetical protein
VRLQLTLRRARWLVLAVLAWSLGASRAKAQGVPDQERAPSEPTKEEDGGPAKPGAERATVVRATSDVAAYGDTDHVFVFTPSIAGTITNPTAGWTIDANYLVDVVSAASVDIVSTASRRWEEVRQAGGVDVAWKPASFGVGLSAAGSVEPDYTSLTGGLSITQDLLAKNLTLVGAYEHGHDVAGRSGTPFSVFSHDIDHDALKGGLTLVVDPATVATGVAEVDFERGDSSKPYRYIPMFAPGTSVPKGASIDQVNALRLTERPLEQLPLSRQRYAITARVAHRYSSSTLRLEERVYDDSWSLLASTTDARFLVDTSKRFEIGPHLRLHVQKAVSFWQRAYVLNPGFDFPALRTGDRELGPLYNATAGGSARLGFGPAFDPMRWSLGADVNGTYTGYLDDLYVTYRISTVVGLTLEGEL